MESLLTRIYDGENPYEKISVDSPEYEERLTAFIEHSKQFQKSLREISGELEMCYLSLQNEQEVVDSYETREAFVRGASFGAELLLDLLRPYS